MEASDRAVIRSYIGTTVPPSDVELAQAFARLGDPYSVALEVLRSRLADFLASPLNWEASGDFKQDATNNVKALRDQIMALEALVPDPPASVGVSRLVRSGRERDGGLEWSGRGAW